MNRSKSNESLKHELAQLRRQYDELKSAYETTIAGQKQTDELLQQCKQKFFVLFEKAAFPAVLSKLPGGIIVEVNEAFEREFGLTKQEVFGKTSIELGINPDEESRNRILETLRKNNSVRNKEIVLRAKSGEINYYETNIDKVVINGEEYLLNTIQNIREFKKTENILKENFDLLRIAGEKAKLGGWNVILKENRSYWSNEVAAIHEMPAGYSPLVEDGMNFYAPEWHDKIREVFSRCVKEGIPYDEEMEIITASGKRLWVRTMGEAVRDKNGNIVKIQGAFQDISEQKNIEEELVKFKLGIERSSEAIFITDVEGYISFVNAAFEQLYGYASEECIGKTPRILKSGTYNEEVYKDFWDTLLSKNSISGEIINKTKEGSLRTIDAYNTSIFDSKGKIYGFIGIHRDITEQKKIETELLKLSRAVEQSPASVVVTDLEGNVEYTNPKTLEITGYTKEELIGKNPRIFNSGEKPKEEYQQLWSTLLSGKEWFGEFHNKKKNGELYWESASISPILNEKKEIINYVAIKEDITERKRFEDTRKILLEISQLVTKHVTLNRFLTEVHKKIKQIIRADNFYVALYNETDNTYTFPYHVDEYDKVEPNKPYDFSNGFTDYILKTNQSFIITPENLPELEKEGTIKGYGDKLSVWLGVPFNITEGSKPNGVIAIQDYNNLESYSETDKSLMEIIAHNIGRFIERIRYVEELIAAKEKAEENEAKYLALSVNLKQERILLRTIIDSIPDSIYVKDLEARKVLANKANCQNCGAEKEEDLLGKDDFDIFPSEIAEKLFNDDKKVINEGVSVLNREEYIKRPNSDEKCLLTSKLPLYDDKGEIVGLVGIGHDITRRKQTEEALRKSEAKLSALFSSMSEMVVLHELVFDREGKPVNYRITDCNDAFTRITGITRDSAVGRLSTEVYGTEEPPYLNKYSEVALTGEPNHYETYFKPMDKYFSISVISPEKYHFATVTTDITERKRNDFLLQEKNEEIAAQNEELNQANLELNQAKDKAEESDRLKSAFLANMSHEIRTPMNGILGFTDLLLNPDLSSDEKEEFIKIVQQSGQRMLSTVNDIVEISKIEAGLVQLNLTKTDVNRRMEELFRFFQAEADKKGIKLSLEMLLPLSDKNITTDQNKLDSILTNLIKNAIKYTESGSIIMGCRYNGPEVQFYVKDTGLGIPKHRQKAIFERFIQADITVTRVFEGAGLGLTISKSYVEMLGGKIWVESEEGKGSIFYFTLPDENRISEESVGHREKLFDRVKADVKSLNILIAEDDILSRIYISHIVKDFGKEIFEAGTGIEAVELCRNTPDIDLILMDIQMPEMNGYDATRRIREFNRDVVIIAQTAFALSGDREKALDAGCNDYIAKPINRTELLTLIKKYFSQ